ncbi:DUF5908 family protein [Marinigracilibium pacificum]|uniref:Uncharacterized protein n=1 Tax=Marinigracilibium pacificum TaxID=2729599 RepID=A0A848J1X7_9BACT|nr:DUF5908 family protein [Marinigracilibium pacificum]NMM48474.1 hypothetical protein [Marinigracilibium pacificum]
MPVEIKELIVRINVNEGNNIINDVKNRNVDKKEIVDACVEQVLHLLERKKER